MLQIQQICKEYTTGKLVQKALDGVSLNLRDNEFVAILGPSGSGKTTLLNIIGGLDRYDSGDLIINGISTKKYKDRDWDSYRNHTIGFVFQSYNLIPHQSVLSNVELALTISGISKAERRERAVKALEQVGLGEQLHKKPNQMSGGQMQRVAIARALVNDPDILLADEPTGALDSDTSLQVMDLLKEVAKDRLVVMVTHNPELAEEYATRIVRLKDGTIRSDSDPYDPNEANLSEPEHKNMGKSSMSFLTALSLSFNNLRTKKARTLLTSFAGSIGIIGIALILSLSTGVNDYIKAVEEDTLSEYPLQIQSTGFDFTSMMGGGQYVRNDAAREPDQINVIQMVTNMFSKMDANDLTSLKNYLDSGKSEIGTYTNAIEYKYDMAPQIYSLRDDTIRQVNPDKTFESLGFGAASGSNSFLSSMMSTDVFYELPEHSVLYEKQYDIRAGRWPENYNECVVVLTSGGSISDFMMYTMGLRDPVELDDMIRQFIDEEQATVPERLDTYTCNDMLGITFKLINSSDYYQYDEQYKVWKNKSEDNAYLKKLVEDGEDITIVGVVQPSEDASGAILSPGIAYPVSLTRHVADQAADSEIVRSQLERKDINVFTNEPFGEERGQSGFDMSSLFTIDEDAMAKVFAFDGSTLTDGLSDLSGLSDSVSLDGASIDLSGTLDLGSIPMHVPSLPEFSMADLLGNLKITASQDDIRQMITELLEGYQDYAAGNPLADYSRLGEYFLNYLQTAEARQILEQHIREMIEGTDFGTVTTDQLQELIRSVLAGYQAYAAANGYTDPERLGEYLMEYLQTAEAQSILEQWIATNVPSVDVTITDGQLMALARDLVNGYQVYAEANTLPDPTKIGDFFLEYLATEDAQRLLTEGISSMVDTGNLEQQIASSMSGYLQGMMGSYSSAISQALEQQITQAVGQIITQIGSAMEASLTQSMNQLSGSLEDMLQIDASAFADAITMNMDGEELAELMMSLSSRKDTSCDGNLRSLGYVDFDVPSGIDIYPRDFEGKGEIVRILDDYNASMEAAGKEDQVITYTDMVGTLMSSVTDIVDIISYVLIAFIAISLVVSSIMIGVITYISVLERKKEIGILRAIGASKQNISEVFNAETIIVGFCAGLIGIGLSLLLLIPGNALIHYLADSNEVNAVLPAGAAVILILLSIFLTFLGGLLPAKKAAKSDPVTALRTD